MSLQKTIFEDLKQSMKSGEHLRKSTLRLIRAAIQNEEISLRRDLTDDETINILTRMSKQHQESIEQFKKGKREDLVTQEEAELSIIREYMPAQLSHEEITQMAKEAIAKLEGNAQSDLGKIMKHLMPLLRGKAQGSEVSQIIKDLLPE